MRKNTRQSCPRRLTELGPWEHAENLDTWTRGGPAGRICSFCGSLDPEEFLARVREGWVVGPTDKTYKAYLGQPVSDEQQEAAKTAWVDRMAAAGGSRTALGQMWDREHTHPAGGQEAKFYFQHLTPDQAREFVQLYNTKAVKIGYPGYFYRLPFFMTPAPAADSTEPDTSTASEPAGES